MCVCVCASNERAIACLRKQNGKKVVGIEVNCEDHGRIMTTDTTDGKMYQPNKKKLYEFLWNMKKKKNVCEKSTWKVFPRILCSFALCMENSKTIVMTVERRVSNVGSGSVKYCVELQCGRHKMWHWSNGDRKPSTRIHTHTRTRTRSQNGISHNKICILFTVKIFTKQRRRKKC